MAARKVERRSRVVVIDVRPYVASRFQWGHVIGRLRQWWRSTGWFVGVPSLSVLSALGRGPPLVRTYVGVRRGVTDDRYIIFATGLRASVHRSRRLLNSTLFARCITHFVIAHFEPVHRYPSSKSTRKVSSLSLSFSVFLAICLDMLLASVQTVGEIQAGFDEDERNRERGI